MTADSDCQWEIGMSNYVQKCKIFYTHNLVTSFQKTVGKKGANGKVLIIINEFVENRYQDKFWDEKILKEIYIYLTKKDKGKTEEEAEIEWKNKVENNEEEKKFQ